MSRSIMKTMVMHMGTPMHSERSVDEVIKTVNVE